MSFLSRRGAPVVLLAAWLCPTAASAPSPPACGPLVEGARPAPASRGPWAAHAAPASPEVWLPRRADEPVRLRDRSSGLEARFRIDEARPAPAWVSAGGASYEGALGAGTALVLRRVARGVEDLVHFQAHPAREQLVYLLDTAGLGGLRRVGGALELLDERGAPRLRVEPPTITGADGRVARASLEIGCAHDRSPAAPWNRPVTPPGVTECPLTVRWEGQGVTYPAVLDPAWVATGDMAETRGYLGATLMDDGRVLAAGGRICGDDQDCTVLASAEIHDPATGTWAATGAMKDPRSQFAIVAIPGHGVTVFGGRNGDTTFAGVEQYDVATGVWQPVGTLGVTRFDLTATLLQDGKTVAIMGGSISSKNLSAQVDLFDSDAMTVTSAADLLSARSLHSTTLLPDGTLLLVAGTGTVSAAPIKTTEIYDPVLQTSVAGPPLHQARLAHAAAAIPIKGKPQVMVSGGLLTSVELFDPVTKSWTLTGSMAQNRAFHSLTLLADGSMLAVGGADFPSFLTLASTERFDPATLLWSSAGPMVSSRSSGQLLTLADGRALILGGITGNVSLPTAPALAHAEIFSALPAATPCATAGECGSLFCVEGVCCDAACDGVCSSCLAAKKGQGQDGSCGPIAAGSDPDSECLDAPPSACATTGQCDGQGQCARYALGAACDTPTCVSGTLTAFTCAADSKCAAVGKSCQPYLCQDGASCASSCDPSHPCATGAHCVQATGTCQGDKPPGQPCAKADECGSGFCVDGVCCATSCDSTCQACTAALKKAGDKDGTCGPARADSDPHNDCEDEPVSSCDHNGLCDGKGSCALYAPTTQCQEPACTGTPTEQKANAYACDGSGTCQATGVSCGLYGCAGGACKKACAADKDCVSQAYCVGGACQLKKDLGTSCSSQAECSNGFCVDGVCCNGPCDGQCEACDVPNAAGFCVPVSGEPHAKRPQCTVAPASEPCKQLACNGVERGSCTGFVGSAVSCRQPACQNGEATLAGVCDGKGNCPEQDAQKCEPFVCLGAACGASCASDAECAAKFQCDPVKHDCVPRTGASCDGDHTLSTPGGQTTDCSPFRCEGASCKTSCSSVLDCVAPSICDEVSRTCVPAAPNPDTAAGCAIAPSPRTSLPLGLLAALGLGLRLRRRARRG